MTNDIVWLDGCSWAASKVISIHNPPPSSGWLLCAAKGNDGAAGRDGRDGANGNTGLGIPSGGSSNQVLIKRSDAENDTAWATLNANQVGAANAEHQHGIDDVVGLRFAFGSMASRSHSHTISDVGGLNESLNGKANVGHNHYAEDIAIGDLTMRSMVLSSEEPKITLRSNESGDMSTIKQSLGGNMEFISSGGLSVKIGDSTLIRAARNSISVDGKVIATSVNAGVDGLIIFGPATPKVGRGEKGQLCWDSEYLYLCIGKGIWKTIRLEELA